MEATAYEILHALLFDYVSFPIKLNTTQLHEYLQEVTSKQRFYLLTHVCDRGFTVVLKAVIRKHLDVITCILDQLSQSEGYELVKKQDGLGFTAIHWAVHLGQRDLLKRMLDSVSANNQIRLLTIQDAENLTALDIAEQCSHPDIADFIRQYKETPSGITDVRNFDDRVADLERKLESLQDAFQTQSRKHTAELTNQRAQCSELTNAVETLTTKLAGVEHLLQQKNQQVSDFKKAMDEMAGELASQKQLADVKDKHISEKANKMTEQIEKNKEEVTQVKAQLNEHMKEAAAVAMDPYREVMRTELRPPTPTGGSSKRFTILSSAIIWFINLSLHNIRFSSCSQRE